MLMATAEPITATEILGEVFQPIEPSFAPEFAQMLLRLRLSDSALAKVRELLRQNNAGTLDPPGKVALETYLLVGQFLDLLQAKARVSMQNLDSSP
jgi:hypothetical protein